MGLYEELKLEDIITPLIGRAEITFTPDGKPLVRVGWKGEARSPWVCYIFDQDRSCPLWHAIYFDIYGFIPKGCRSCWKVVMTIPTVRQLFKIDKWMEEGNSKYNCKCGVERRQETGKLGKYGAYWYAPISEGLKGGREMYKYLQKEFPGVKLLLKRGCTEMEARWRPSDKWDEFAEKGRWDYYEEKANSLFILEDIPFGITPEVFKPVIKTHWIEWAFEHGDETYLDFVDLPFKEEYTTYQSSIHNEKDFIGSKFEPIKMKGMRDGADTYVGTEEGRDNHGSEELEEISEKSGESGGNEATRLTLLS